MAQRKNPKTIAEIFDARTPIVNAARRAVRAAIGQSAPKRERGKSALKGASKKSTARSRRRAA